MKRMANVIVLPGMDFSDAGLGKIENTSVLISESSTAGFLTKLGTPTANAAWGQRVKFTDLTDIPEGTTYILGYTNMFSDSADNFYPCICYYDSEGASLGTAYNEFTLAPISKTETGTFTTGGAAGSTMKVKAGYVKSKIPTGAAKVRFQWFYKATNISGIDADVLISESGPELVWNKD